jgi:predicted MFS family arabinose efflux permease
VSRSGLAPGSTGGEPHTRHTGSVLRLRGLLPLLATLLLMVAALTTGDMALVAWTRNEGMPAMAGVLGALWAIGSGVGGLVMGGRPGRPRLALRVAAMSANFVVLTPLLPPVLEHASVWLVGGAALVAGTTIAPAVAATNSRLGAIAPAGRQGEAAGWMSTAMTTGGATAAPVIGLLLDHAGPAAATAFGALAITAGAVLARRVPGSGSGERVEQVVEDAGTEAGVGGGITAVPEAG